MAITIRTVFLAIFCAFVDRAAGRAFLGDIAKWREADKITEECAAALAESLGPGHGVTQLELLRVWVELKPALESLPKCEKGRLALNSVQYIVHRYFMELHGISIRGFEPHRQANATISGLRLLGAPQGYLDLVATGRLAEHGFALSDIVALVFLLERLFRESSGILLGAAYEKNFWDTTNNLDMRSLEEVMDTYFYHWLRGHNLNEFHKKDHNRNRVKGTMKSWVHGIEFLYDTIALDLWEGHEKANPFAIQKHTFKDVERMMHRISLGFGEFWVSECQITRDLLEDYDETHTGRLRLTDLHDLSENNEHEEFHESKKYLKELGALDETSEKRGPQVVIANYLEAPSQCVVTSRQYSVCCNSGCESVIGRLEERIRHPVAPVKVVVGHVLDIIDEDGDGSAPRKLEGDLEAQLQRISDTHGGQVPIHGRLFAQWLHYVFPRVCPFPHATGAIKPMSKAERATEGRVKATKKERLKEEEKHDERVQAAAEAGSTGEPWMSQWSDEEELLARYIHLHAPWEAPQGLSSNNVSAVVLVCALFVLTRWGISVHRSRKDVKSSAWKPTSYHV